VAYHPAYAMALLVFALLAAMTSWTWLRFAKYPTNAHRDNAARFTGLLFGMVAIVAAATLLVGPASAQTIVAAPPHTSVVNGFIVTEGDISDRPYVPMGTVTAKAGKFSWVSRNPDHSDVDRKLREKAQQMGADAVIRVRYTPTGASLMSWGGIKAEGMAIRYSGPPQQQPAGSEAR
jgi:hypothetical protein